jgi:beta-N-acetylhexosaminidase
MKNGKPDPTYFSSAENRLYPYQVSENLYSNQLTVDSVWNTIFHSELKNRGTYKYSDLDFLLLQKIVENLSEQPLDQFVLDNFYKPLGMNKTCYNPYKCFPLETTPPTENDDYFRKEKIPRVCS